MTPTKRTPPRPDPRYATPGQFEKFKSDLADMLNQQRKYFFETWWTEARTRIVEELTRVFAGAFAGRVRTGLVLWALLAVSIANFAFTVTVAIRKRPQAIATAYPDGRTVVKGDSDAIPGAATPPVIACSKWPNSSCMATTTTAIAVATPNTPATIPPEPCVGRELCVTPDDQGHQFRVQAPSDCWVGITDSKGRGLFQGNWTAVAGWVHVKNAPATLRAGCPGKLTYYAPGKALHPANLSGTPAKSEVVELP